MVIWYATIVKYKKIKFFFLTMTQEKLFPSDYDATNRQYLGLITNLQTIAGIAGLL